MFLADKVFAVDALDNTCNYYLIITNNYELHNCNDLFRFLAYRPCDPQIVVDRQKHLEAAYEELVRLAAARLGRLGESRTLWQFYWDMADTENWIREKEQLMSSPDLGHDLTSIQLLVSKHKVDQCYKVNWR